LVDSQQTDVTFEKIKILLIIKETSNKFDLVVRNEFVWLRTQIIHYYCEDRTVTPGS
jgi:hypothetical protein